MIGLLWTWHELSSFVKAGKFLGLMNRYWIFKTDSIQLINKRCFIGFLCFNQNIFPPIYFYFILTWMNHCCVASVVDGKKQTTNGGNALMYIVHPSLTSYFPFPGRKISVWELPQRECRLSHSVNILSFLTFAVRHSVWWMLLGRHCVAEPSRRHCSRCRWEVMMSKWGEALSLNVIFWLWIDSSYLPEKSSKLYVTKHQKITFIGYVKSGVGNTFKHESELSRVTWVYK
jgi:hypothetical protein